MEVRAFLSEYKNVSVDTNLFIYAFEQHPEFGKTVKEIFNCIEEGLVSATASTITLTEILVKPIREKNQTLEKRYKLLFTHFPNLSLVPINYAVAERAAHLRGIYSIKTPDALILASAIISKAEVFITNDERLSNISEIPCIPLSRFIEQSLD